MNRVSAVFVAAVLVALVLAAPALAQSRSVWVEDYGPEGVKAAVAAGRTTLVYAGGSSLAVTNHVEVARYVARRVAEELTNALVLPVGAGAADAFDAVSRAMASGGFKNVMVMADDGPEGDAPLESIAKALDREWRPKGVGVYFIHAHEMRPGQGMTFNADYLRRWAAKTVPAGRRKSVEDHAELLFVDRDHTWLRPDLIPAEDRSVVNAALGRVFVETRVASILDQIRRLSPSHVR